MIKEANEKLMRIKDEFMFRTVHDLRGPASTAKFIVEKYQTNNFGKCNPEEVRKDMKTIGELNQDLLTMIEDLLQVAKGEQADVHLAIEPIDLKNMIASILSEFEPEISRRSLKLDYAPGEMPSVLADRLRLREVFANLIENAVKYNRAGGFLAVRHEKKESFLITHIENTSIDSLSPQDMEKFFKPYAQIGKDEELGNGLGLYIVKKLVEKMGGEASVAFDSGKDIISFHISLPIAKK
jgi:signal transduction histidine kinase